MQTEKLALSITETAALLGVSRPTVYNLIHSAGFPSFRIGGRVVVSRSGLEEWINHQIENGGAAI